MDGHGAPNGGSTPAGRGLSTLVSGAARGVFGLVRPPWPLLTCSECARAEPFGFGSQTTQAKSFFGTPQPLAASPPLASPLASARGTPSASLPPSAHAPRQETRHTGPQVRTNNGDSPKACTPCAHAHAPCPLNHQLGGASAAPVPWSNTAAQVVSPPLVVVPQQQTAANAQRRQAPPSPFVAPPPVAFASPMAAPPSRGWQNAGGGEGGSGGGGASVLPAARHLGGSSPVPVRLDSADDIFGPLKAVLSNAKKRPAVDDLLASYTPMSSLAGPAGTPATGGGPGSASGVLSLHGGSALKRQRLLDTAGVNQAAMETAAFPMSPPFMGATRTLGGGATTPAAFASPAPPQQQQQYMQAQGQHNARFTGGSMPPPVAQSPFPQPPPPTLSRGGNRMMASTPENFAVTMPSPMFGDALSAGREGVAVTQTARRIAETLNSLIGPASGMPHAGGLSHSALADVAGPHVSRSGATSGTPSWGAPPLPPPPPPLESLMGSVPTAVFDVPLPRVGAPVVGSTGGAGGSQVPLHANAPAAQPPAPATTGGWDPDFMRRNQEQQVQAAEAAAQEAAGKHITVAPKTTTKEQLGAHTSAPAPPAAAPAASTGGWSADFLAKTIADAQKAADAAALEAKGVQISINKPPAGGGSAHAAVTQVLPPPPAGGNAFVFPMPTAPKPAEPQLPVAAVPPPQVAPPTQPFQFQFGSSQTSTAVVNAAPSGFTFPRFTPPAPQDKPPALAPQQQQQKRVENGENKGQVGTEEDETKWGPEQLRGLYVFTHDAGKSFTLPPPLAGAPKHTFRPGQRCFVKVDAARQMYTFRAE